MAEHELQKVNSTTYQAVPSDSSIEAVVGDEKQSKFFPRVKLKKWNNEVNLSIGTKQLDGQTNIDNNVVTYSTTDQTARFYAIGQKESSFDTTGIRLINLGGISPERIGSIYELDRHTFWSRQTIVTHHSNIYAMMYYGLYPANAYVDTDRIDIPEVRVSAHLLQNDPMVMDPSLKLVDIHYNPKRDSMDRIHEATKTAITTVLKKHGISVSGDRKLYFKDGTKDVKFFSTAFVAGHYYYYINLGLDYQKAHQYFKPDIEPRTKDSYAYGLRTIVPSLPDSVVDEIIVEYAKNYGLNLDINNFTDEEESILSKLDVEHKDVPWIREAKRDIFENTAKGFDDMGDGFEFEIELASRPSSNSIPLSVQTKGLDFHYQPELTADESRTSFRPQNVIGSYVAYRNSEINEKYKNGKAFHIYRPWAVDKTGKKVWCAFDPDWDGQSDLHMTIPQDFLDTATYPVIVDPTFGYSAVGASSDSTEGILAITATATDTTIATISASVVATNTGKLALYDNGTKVYDSIENTANAGGWLELPVIGDISAKAYQLAFWQKAGGYNMTSYDTVTGAGLISTTAYVAGNNGFPGTVAFTANDKQYSIYGTYRLPYYVGVILATAGLQHYYKCDETTGATLEDRRGNEDLTTSGTVVLNATPMIAGDLGGSFSTKTGTNGIAKNTSHVTIVGGDFTYECWVDLSAAASGSYIFTEGKDTSNYAGITISAVAGTTARLALVCRNASGNVSSSGSAYFDTTIPHYVVFRGTRATNTLEVIVDAGNITGASITTYPTGTYSNTGFAIGALWRGSAAAYGKVSVAHLASYNVALTDAQIRQHYTAGVAAKMSFMSF